MHYLLSFLLFISLLLIVGGQVIDYDCDVNICDGDVSRECVCASNQLPGGLTRDQTPQFIVITNDDAVTTVTGPAFRQITDPHRNANGCGVPATFYISIQYSDPQLIRALYDDSHEIATHSTTHSHRPNRSDIAGARDWLVEQANIPYDQITGFRAPYLNHSSVVRRDLYELGFRYDSSITEQYNEQSKTSPGPGKRLWPYTMDYGIPQDCSIGSGVCTEEERYEGMWEIPMLSLQGNNDRPIASMDPPTLLEDAFTIYSREFDRLYHGNRAPLGIYLHAAWLLQGSHHVNGMNEFIRYALGHEHVWFVTASQLLNYIRNPVAADQFAASFTSNVQCPLGAPPIWSSPSRDPIPAANPNVADGSPSQTDIEQADDEGSARLIGQFVFVVSVIVALLTIGLLK
jgi:peptidoglycan/xylan/chitin deacetylase (PgdA/CDA1 family)